MLTPEQRSSNLAVAAIASVRSEQQYGVPALVTLAQWVEESGWGEHAPGCNCFGIKKYSGCYGVQKRMTSEYVNDQETHLEQEFATFQTMQHCFDYHAALLAKGKPYYAAFVSFKKSANAESFVRNIASHYAPHNLSYPDHIIRLMHDQRLIHALEEARAHGVHPIA